MNMTNFIRILGTPIRLFFGVGYMMIVFFQVAMIELLLGPSSVDREDVSIEYRKVSRWVFKGSIADLEDK